MSTNEIRKMNTEEIWNYLEDTDIATAEELQLITSINGYSEETLNDVLYCRTGYRSVEQYAQYEDCDFYCEHFYDEEEDEDE